MKRMIDSDSGLWRVTSVFTGAGCTFLGPVLPALNANWHLHDRQAGLLVSCLFFGSFSGTLLLSSKLRRTLLVGSWAACLGLLLFAGCLARDPGVAATAASLALMGFGLGQLMSSINLLTGSAEGSKRAAALAGIAAAFCVGAILSPVLTTVLIRSVPMAVRLALFAPLFLLPAFWSRGRELPGLRKAAAEVVPLGRGLRTWHPAWSCIAAFLAYGGVEACIGNWMPLFATRYQLGVLGRAQWIASLFWLGLSSGRIIMTKFLRVSREEEALRVSIVASAACLGWLVVAPSPVVLLATCVLVGICLGPVFPLLLSASIGYGLSERTLGLALAACGLGAAVFPSLLGLAAANWSLRAGMMVPIAGLCMLLVLRWRRTSNAGALNPVPQN